MDKDLQSIQEARQLVACASAALAAFREFDQSQVDRIVAAMAAVARQNARRLAEMAVSETGYGRVEDKVTKNLFAAVEIYNYMKDLRTCGVISENKDKGVIDIAVPAGVIAAVIPTTNPTSTAIFKVLASLKGRNTVVISPHPNARECTIETARIMRQAAETAGAPEGCIGWMETVTLEGTQELMRHRQTNLILATGGAELVRAAYSSGKPAYGVGPGNVPAFIEKTANVSKAVRDVIAGKVFDYGVLCSSEQSLICDRPIEAQVLTELKNNLAFVAEEDDLRRLENLVQTPDGRFNTAIVGKSPRVLAEMAGIQVPADVSCLVGRPAGVGPEHPLSREKLSPILALFTEDGWEAGCRRCIQILEYGGLGHTMSIHSGDRDVILEFGLHKPAYRVCVNTPATFGSIGLTTGVPPSMTLGCGTPGGNITSDNITPLHLINVRRLAWEQRSVDQISFDRESGGQAESADAPDAIRAAVRSVVEDYLDQKKKTLIPSDPAPSAPELTPPLRVEPRTPDRPAEPAVDFVCEDDVRRAVRKNRKIVINADTIVTPAARDLGEDKNVFIGGGERF